MDGVPGLVASGIVDVRLWHLADMTSVLCDVRFRG
jgi:hypothetical protein